MKTKITKKMEIYFDDLNQDAQQEYIEVIGAKTLDEINMITPIAIIEIENNIINNYSVLTERSNSNNITSYPGPEKLTYDDTTKTGYYGHTTAVELITGDALASQIGLTAGTSQFSDAGWEKFFVGADADCNPDSVDKVLYIAKKSLRYDLSWDNINAANAVYGSQTITIGSNTYKVRLLRGAGVDPAPTYGTTCSDDPGANSEWNDLLYRIHTDIPNCSDPTIGMPGGSETSYHGGPQVGSNWNNYSDSDLQVYYSVAGNGTYCWCQETDASISSRRVFRGSHGVAYYVTHT